MASITSRFLRAARRLGSPQRRRRIACEPLDRRLLMAAGDPDPTFGNNGWASISFPGQSFQVQDVAVMPNGKIVVVGAKAGNVAAARLNADGTPDGSFASGGLYESSLPAASTLQVVVQPDGKPIIVYPGSFFYALAARVIRLTTVGTPDFGFGNSGTTVLSGRLDTSAALQNDGKIVVVGFGGTGGDPDFGISRINSDGSPDLAFGTLGEVDVGFGEQERARTVAIDYNGSPTTNPLFGTIVVAGTKYFDGQTRFAICRLLSNGELDDRFDSDGKLTAPDLSPNPTERPEGVLIQPGGKIVVAGTADSPTAGYDDFLLARFLSHGPLDSSFGSAGTGIVQTDLGADELARELSPSFGGGFILGGERLNAAIGVACVLAYTRDGDLDTRFSGDGWLTAPYGGRGAIAITGNAIAPIRRLFLTGGSNVGRYIDVGPVVSLGSFDPNAHEAGQDPASYLVGRTRIEPVVQRVYLTVSGAARPPYLVNADYTVSGMTLVHPFQGRSYVDIPAGQSIASASIIPINDTLPEGDETVVFSIAADEAYDIGTPASTTMVIRDDDLTGGPGVAEATFLYETAPQRVQFRFNQDVASSISAADFQVTGPAGTSAHAFDYDNITNTATLTFGGILPDGDFTARAIAAGITNAAGQPMAADHVLDFFFLRGDANRDRRVNLQDFNRLAANFGQSPRTFSQGDFNYDTIVNLQDFNLLASRFGTSLGGSTVARDLDESDRRSDDVDEEVINELLA